MDWITQRTFQNWVIGVLVALNLGLLAFVWFQSDRKDVPPPRGPRNAPGFSVQLMQQELGLSPPQVAHYEKLRTEQMEMMKAVNDELDSLKLQLVDDMFDPPSTPGSLDSAIARVGMLQAKLEMLRFRHFSALAQVCDAGQKERLRPILKEVFGRRGPAAPSSHSENARPVPRPGAEERRQSTRAGEVPHDDRGQKQFKRPRENQGPVGRQDDRGEERPAPPSLEEKLDRYTERLSLTAQQRESVEKILSATREQEESFKARVRPSRDEFEREKQRLRTQEDDSIMRLLDHGQKSEFKKMISKRGTPPPRP